MLKINNSIQLDNFFKKKFKKEKNIISNDKLNVINKLKKMGHKIILFSNNYCLLEDYFDEYYGLFNKIFYSFDIGYTKNETESYRYIEKNMGYKPWLVCPL